MQKLHLLLLSLVFLTIGAGCASIRSQDSGDSAAQPVHAAIAVRTDAHLEVALMSAHQMLDGERLPAERVDIIVCGPPVQSLTPPSEFADDIRRLTERGSQVVACGVTMERMGLGPKDLLPEVSTVPNAFIELIAIQQEGVITIEL